MLTHAQWCDVLRSESLPAAIVDLDAFDANVRQLAATAGAKRVRLATKSLRCVELVRRAQMAAPSFHGLMCYSGREAEFLAAHGFDDLFVAYPVARDEEYGALRRVHESGKQVSVAVDAPDALRRLGAAMSGVRRPLPVVIDCDVSLRILGGLIHVGVRRSPIVSVDGLRALLAASRDWTRELRVVGLMAYEAQVAGLGDQNPFKRFLNPAFKLIRWVSRRAVWRQRAELAETMDAHGHPLEIFNGGGTGSVDYCASEPWLTEVTVGSGLFGPHLFDYYSNIRFRPALYFAVPVVRRPAPGMVTCFGGGYVSSGEPGWDKVPRPVAPEGAELLSHEGCGEVQTPLKLRPGADLALGDPVVFRPAKAGEMAERFDEFLLMSGGKVVGRVPTYRGHKTCFG